MTSADYALQAVKGIKESFDNGANNSIMQYKDANLFYMVNTSEVDETFTSTEGLSGTKELAELETPPTNKLEDGYSVTLTESRYGNSIVISEKMYRRDGKDNTMKVADYLERQRNKLLLDVENYFLTDIHSMYNNAFDSSADTLAPDGVELCGTHTWKSGGTFTNKATAALSESAIDAAEEYAGAFTSPDGKPMPLNFDTIVVKKGSAAHRTAIKQFAMGINPTAVGDVNIYEGLYKIIATPYITTANKNYWFLLDSKLGNPLYVGIGEAPTMREPKVLENEAIRSNVTGFWKIWINNMPYAIYGSTWAA